MISAGTRAQCSRAKSVMSQSEGGIKVIDGSNVSLVVSAAQTLACDSDLVTGDDGSSSGPPVYKWGERILPMDPELLTKKST